MTVISNDKIDHQLTHGSIDQEFDLFVHEKNLRKRTELLLPLEQELEILNQLSQFELGRFLLTNKGLNGYWTSYIILNWKNNPKTHPLEKWMLERSPGAIATRERFDIFKKQFQQRLKDNIKIASVPCGLMDDLLSLDYSKIHNIGITGIDIDEQSLNLAKENAIKHKIKNVNFIKKNAWGLGIAEEYDLLTSNGLNIYQPDNEKVILLYKDFYNALKPGGILITSFLTPPPTLSKESPWKNYAPKDSLKQAVIFNDIIQSTWQSFRTEKESREQLEKAGFKIIDIIYDSQGIFPTIIAKK